MAREASAERNTKETEIKLKINLDGTGYSDIETGVGFFNHMLDGFTRHGLFDLSVRVHGDLQVDDHHTIEDTGIVLGTALKEAIGDKKGIKRYGMNLHIRVLAGGNNHHVAEAMFKSFAKALDAATSYDPRITDVLSTKGSL